MGKIYYEIEVIKMIQEIKILMIRHGVKQIDLVRQLNLSPQMVSGVLTGRIRSLPTEIKILTYLRSLNDVYGI